MANSKKEIFRKDYKLKNSSDNRAFIWISAEIAPENSVNQLENNYTNVQHNDVDSNDKIPILNDDIPVRSNFETRKSLSPEKSFFPGHDSASTYDNTLDPN